MNTLPPDGLLPADYIYPARVTRITFLPKSRKRALGLDKKKDYLRITVVLVNNVYQEDNLQGYSVTQEGRDAMHICFVLECPWADRDQGLYVVKNSEVRKGFWMFIGKLIEFSAPHPSCLSEELLANGDKLSFELEDQQWYVYRFPTGFEVCLVRDQQVDWASMAQSHSLSLSPVSASSIKAMLDEREVTGSLLPATEPLTVLESNPMEASCASPLTSSSVEPETQPSSNTDPNATF